MEVSPCAVAADCQSDDDGSTFMEVEAEWYPQIGGAAYPGQGRFIAKLDDLGRPTWFVPLVGMTSWSESVELAADGAGGVYTYASLDPWNPWSIGGALLTNPTSDTGFFVVHLDAAGAPLWARVWTSPGGAHAGRLTPDPAGGALIGGSFYGPALALDGLVVPATGADNSTGFLAQLDAEGLLRSCAPAS